MKSHGPLRGRLGRPRSLAQPRVRRGARRSNSSTRSLSGVATTTGLVLDSVEPPAGPTAPRLSLKDDNVGGAKSRPRNGPDWGVLVCGQVLGDW